MKADRWIHRFEEMEEQLGYDRMWKPSFLFQRLNEFNYSVEEKTGFVLYCYGWNRYRRTAGDNFTKRADYDRLIFHDGNQFMEEFNGLLFPCKSSSTKSGSHLWIHFSRNPVIAAGISAHFKDQVIPIGVERSFSGYEEDNEKNCWEDISIPPDELMFDEVHLYLGKSGKVYWFCYDGDSFGIAADSLFEFFSIRFSFMEEKHFFDVNLKWTAAELELMRNCPEGHQKPPVS